MYCIFRVSCTKFLFYCMPYNLVKIVAGGRCGDGDGAGDETGGTGDGKRKRCSDAQGKGICVNSELQL